MASDLDQRSRKLSTICAIATAALMIVLRPVFLMSAETTFLGGIFGAILFFFLLIWMGHRMRDTVGWIGIGVCEVIALIVSFIIHPVCTTTCLLFSIPVVIYIKWAATKIRQNDSKK